MAEDLLALYEEEQQFLLEINEGVLKMAENGTIAKIVTNLSPLAQEEFFQLRVCTEYIDMLKTKTVWSDRNRLAIKHNRLKGSSTGPTPEKTYLSQILAAAFFDRRKEREDYINVASKYSFGLYIEGNRRTRAINYYIRARILAELKKDDPSKEGDYQGCFEAALLAKKPDASKVLAGLLEELAANANN